MTRAPFIVIDGKLYRWKDILELRRAQLAAAGAVQASQLALIASLHRFNRMGLMRLKLIETGGANCAPSPPMQQSLPLLFGDG
jgi:hypothetical protein